MTKTYINIAGDVRDAASLSVPSDRAFRGAWQFSGEAVEIDMVKARDIHRNVLRRERDPLLERLDVAYMKALETGGDTASVASEKQKLRDVTDDPRIEAAATPDELKALTLAAFMAQS